MGDFSNTSNLAAYNTVRLQELWLQKEFWEKRISLKVGNMAVDNEFFQSSSAALFINGTFGAFTFIGSNVPNAPVYPVASPGVRIQFLPTSKFYVMAGVYGMDNNSEPRRSGQPERDPLCPDVRQRHAGDVGSRLPLESIAE